ncbi:membrane-spanning 4-domains subfamily A member 8-like [Sceloporus undulatus]|uniref:membrane-spanning 4-domains subfamily A member 8-like n=1 Tax=Sceloporus undulatus TaxID=8520 RepID=UPI001C4BFCEE|nr:membrane-spanning 4-domains subfamily A member 8-like [Sceloporus undulatus]
MANGTVVFLAPNGANQAGQRLPGATIIQPPGTVQYVQYGGQPVGNPSNPQVGPLEKFLKVETKTLGAIQIFIGLIHIGLGAISAAIWGRFYLSIATIGGYVFWGALFFIISGSLSVSAEKHLTPGLVNASVGMNITSAIMALTGTILLLVDVILNCFYSCPYDYDCYWERSIGTGISVLLLLFSLLEFCITVSTAHFGCQATSCCRSAQQPVVFVPYTVSENVVAPSEEYPSPPPAYNAVDSSPNRQ